MSFTKSTIERLQKIFQGKVSTLGGLEWIQLVESIGVTIIPREDLYGDCDRYQGCIALQNPNHYGDLQTQSVLIIPHEIAKRILVLGYLPEKA